MKAAKNGRAKKAARKPRTRPPTEQELAEAEARQDEAVRRMPVDKWTVMRIALLSSRKRWLCARAVKAKCKNPSEYVRAIIDEHAEDVEAPWGRKNPERHVFERSGKR
jgi:hypothetical protein